MSRLIGCPGAGLPPAHEAANQPHGYPLAGKAPCSRCGNLYALRSDGRIRAHRVDESAIVPMIRGVTFTAGRTESRRS